VGHAGILHCAPPGPASCSAGSARSRWNRGTTTPEVRRRPLPAALLAAVHHAVASLVLAVAVTVIEVALMV